MERNPYAPPVSPVADPTELRGPRPKEVTRAVRLLWVSLVLSIAGLFMQPTRAASHEEQVVVTTTLVVGGVIGFGLWGWVLLKIGAGRNWARIVFIVLTIIGLAITPFVMPYSLSVYRTQPLSGVSAAANAILELAALYLLLTAPARAWFKPKNPSPNSDSPPTPPATQ